MAEKTHEDDVVIHCGDCRAILPTLDAQSMHCCVTSPPYWGLRDYGHDDQLGMEETPEEYVATMVDVFREVRRVLRDDGTLWLNLGSNYAGSGKGGGGSHEADGMTNSAGVRVSSHDSGPSPSPLLRRGPSCGSDGKAPLGFQVSDHAYPDCDDERQAETPNHRVCNAHSGQCDEQAEQPFSPTGHDSGRSDCGPLPPVSELPDVRQSTTPESSCQPSDVSALSATASVCQQGQSTSSLDGPSSEHKRACTSGTSPMLPPLVVRTMGKESFFSACGRSDCKGIGRCGLCWCSLAIPSLNVKPKDELNIPHLVAMALQADGWVLRQTLIWHKPNPMPESVTDRCTKAHEYIFLLSKSAKYYYDVDAIRQPHQDAEKERNRPSKRDNMKKRVEAGDATYHIEEHQTSMDRPMAGHIDGRNRRSVWTVVTKPFKGAHFAVFPPELIAPCIQAGCPEGGTVLDPFTGSGTTAVVAQHNGCKFVGCEINKEYAEMARNRSRQRGLFGAQ